VWDGFEAKRRDRFEAGQYVALVVDAIWIKIRRERKRPLLVATGVDWEGGYEVSDWGCAQGESGAAWERLVVFYRFPEQWWYRIRRVNLAEGLFKRARVFFRRYPGWESPEHAMQAFGIFLLGSSAYRHANRHIFEPNAFSLMPPGNLNTSS
jgi:transposase-like protein